MSSSPFKEIPLIIKETHPKHTHVFAVVLFYMSISITMVLANKAVLTISGLPITFLFGQIVMAVFLLLTAGAFGFLRIPPLDFGVIKALAPLVSMNVIGLVLNTLCLHHVDAVLYQVARSLILPMTVAATPLVLGHPLSKNIVLSVCLVTIGFIVGIFGESEMKVSGLGVFFGIASSLSTVAHSFLIKNSFQCVKNNGPFDLVYYNNILSLPLMLPLLAFESKELILKANDWEELRIFLLGIAFSGIFGILINLAGFLQIKVTSPMTHTVSSAARGVLQTIAAYYILGEAVTVARSVGIGIVLVGSMAYSLAKHQQQNQLEKYKQVS